MRILLAAYLALAAFATDYRAPAGIRPAVRRPGGASILPGGRIIAPLGSQHVTGPGPFGLAISPNGRTVVSSNGGPNRYSLTVLQREKEGAWSSRHLLTSQKKNSDPKDAREDDEEWRSVFMGLAFSGEHSIWASEGNSGRVRFIDLANGATRRYLDLNQEGFADSYTGDLAFDRERGLLYILDQANFRMAIADTRRNRIVSSLRLGRLPFAIALSPDKRKAYVTNIGMFEYKPLPGADPKSARETGLSFPAFGFPSAEARHGARRETARGPVDVPGLGDPNVRESNSLAVVDVADPAAPRLETFLRTGLPFGARILGGSSPSGVLAAAGRVFVSNGHNDSITVIDAATDTITAEVPLRIPGLENLRGILPIGMAFDDATGWLLVAEAGINAIGVIDTKAMRAIAHLPAAWFPTRVLLDRDRLYVANAKGQGTGPNAYRGPLSEEDTWIGSLRRGSISVLPVPSLSELAAHTAVVMGANGFKPAVEPAAPLPSAIRYVVLIVKENRTYDEVFGDVAKAANGPLMGVPQMARLGMQGYISGNRKRFSLHAAVTPNHHAIAARWVLSDNFYADSEVSVDGHHWLVGSYPDAWTESTLMAAYGGQKDFRMPTTAPGRLLFPESSSSVHPEEQLEAGAIWHHLERHGVTFRNFGEGFELAGVNEGPGLKPTGARFLTNVPMPDPLYRNTSRQYPQFNMNIPDQFRATQFIKEIEEKYVKSGEEFPRFIFIHLPNDHMAKPRPRGRLPLRSVVRGRQRLRARPHAGISFQEPLVAAHGGVHHGGRCAGRPRPYRRASHRTPGRRSVFQAQLRIARQLELPQSAENDLPAAGSAAAESLRRRRDGPQRLLHR